MSRWSVTVLGWGLAAWLATGCATGRTDEAELLARGTPLLDRLASGKLAESGIRGKALLAAARADKALYEARPVEAADALGEALSALPPDVPACATRGLLLYLKGAVASLGGSGAWDAGFKELGDVCLDRAAGGPGEVDARLFLLALARTDELSGPAGPSAGGPEGGTRPGSADAGQKRRDRELQRIANQLGGDRGRVINALALFLRESAAVNPDECDPTFSAAHRERLASAWGELERLGRADLGIGYWAMAVVADDGKLRAQDVARLNGWLARPENGWLRGEAASRFLSTVRYSADWADPLLTLPVCRVYFDSVIAAAAGDKGPGVASRNATRLMSALQAAGACLNPVDLSRLTDAVLGAATKEGKKGLLPVLGGVAVNLALTFVDGRTDLIPVVLGQLSAGMERLGGRLTDSPEDRVVGEIARLVSALGPFMQGWDLATLGSEIQRSAAAMDSIAALPTTPESDELVRLAPALRAGLVALLAGEQLLEGRQADAEATLARLEKTLPGDLAALLAWFGQPDHSGAILRIFGGVRKSLRIADQEGGNGFDEALKALEEASVAGPAESGWWSIGLDAARFLSFDLLAIVAHGTVPDDRIVEALARAEELAVRAVDSVALEVELPPAVEAVLRLVPAAHRAIPALLGPDDVEVAPKIAALLEQPLKEVLGDTLEDGLEKRRTVADLVIDLLRAAAGVGLTSIVEKPEEAVGKMAGFLESRMGRYPGDVRAFLALGVASARLLADPSVQPTVFDPVRPLLERHMPKLGFVPDLILAAARKNTASPEEQLALVERILSVGAPLEACGRSHAVHSLLPYKIQLLAKLGRFPEATAAWQQLDRLLRKGFAGSGSLSCFLESNSGNVMFTANVGNTVEGLLLAGKEEGTFNVGLGGRWLDGGAPQSGDQLTCQAVVPQAVRQDRVAEAHLAYAAYALLAGDDRLAHRALASAQGACQALLNASPVTLGRFKTGQLDDARKKFDYRLLAWTANLARFRGHTQIALDLEGCAAVLGSESGTAWNMARADLEEPPILLAGLPALEGFGELVWFRHQLIDPSQLKVLEDGLLKWNKKARILPAWGIRLGLDSLLLQVDPSRAATGFRTAVPDARKEPLGHSLASLMNLRLEGKEAVDDELVPKLRGLAEPAFEAGLYAEVAAAATSLAVEAQWAGTPAIGINLIEAVRERIPAEGAEVVQVNAIRTAVGLLEGGGQPDALARANAMLVDNASHLMPAGDNIQRRFQLLTFLGQTGDGASMQQYLSQLMPMLHRAVGSANGDYYILLSTHAALDLLGGDLDTESARTLASYGTSIQANADAIRFFELIVASQGLEDRQRIAREYLVFQFQGGPMPQPAPHPPSNPTRRSNPTPSQTQPASQTQPPRFAPRPMPSIRPMRPIVLFPHPSQLVLVVVQVEQAATRNRSELPCRLVIGFPLELDGEDKPGAHPSGQEALDQLEQPCGVADHVGEDPVGVRQRLRSQGESTLREDIDIGKRRYPGIERCLVHRGHVAAQRLQDPGPSSRACAEVEAPVSGARHGLDARERFPEFQVRPAGGILVVLYERNLAVWKRARTVGGGQQGHAVQERE